MNNLKMDIEKVRIKREMVEEEAMRSGTDWRNFPFIPLKEERT